VGVKIEHASNKVTVHEVVSFGNELQTVSYVVNYSSEKQLMSVCVCVGAGADRAR